MGNKFKMVSSNQDAGFQLSDSQANFMARKCTKKTGLASKIDTIIFVVAT